MNDTRPAPSSVASVRAPRRPRHLRTEWVDRFLSSDPGLNRFRSSLHTVLVIALIIEAELLFVRYTHALQVPASRLHLSAAQVAAVAGANHDFLVIAELLGAIVGMVSTFAIMDTTAKAQLVSLSLYPVGIVPSFALGIAIGGDRILALVVVSLVIALGTYLRRFGPRGFATGVLLFVGYLLGFFLHHAIVIGDIGWLIAEIGVGLVVAAAVRFGVFYPRQAKALERTQRSFAARAGKVAALAYELFEDPGHSERAARLLHRRLIMLNETALMIDAQLGDPSALADGSSGQLLHQRLFDMELAMTNIARFAQALARLEIPSEQRTEIGRALLAIVERDGMGSRRHATNLFGALRGDGALSQAEDGTTAILVHRFAGSVIDLADAWAEWSTLGTSDRDGRTFQPSVILFGGWLPGSALVSAAASREGSARSRSMRFAPYTRSAIQIGVAVGAATFVGVQISSSRFYWAVIAAFVTFVGTNNSAEQLRKGISRVVGTVIGVGIGSLLVDAVGDSSYASVVVILAALFFGFYLMRVDYAFTVVGVTVMASQLYADLHEFSNSLLLLRLGETAAGAVVGIIVAVTILPVRTRHVLRVAARNHVRAIGSLADQASRHLLGTDRDPNRTLRADARDVDATYQALVATAEPLRWNLIGKPDERIVWVMLLASASRHYCRNLVGDVEAAGVIDSEVRLDIERASATLHESLGVVVGALTGSRDVTYTRSAALFDRAERRLETSSASLGGAQLAIRDLMLIDGAMAQVAVAMGLAIGDYDTAGVAGQ